MNKRLKYLTLAFGLSTILGSGSVFAAGEKIEFVAGMVGIPVLHDHGMRGPRRRQGARRRAQLAGRAAVGHQHADADSPGGDRARPGRHGARAERPDALISIVDDLVKNKKIPVVTVDGSLNEPVDVQNMRTDNLTAGGLAAEAMAQAIGGEGTVLIVALNPGVVGNQQRADGFLTVLKEKYPDIKVLPIEYPGLRPEQGRGGRRRRDPGQSGPQGHLHHAFERGGRHLLGGHRRRPRRQGEDHRL